MSLISNVRSRHRAFSTLLDSLVVTEELSTPAKRRAVRAEGYSVLWLFHINSWLIDRFGGTTPTRWAPDAVPWGDHLRAAWPQIKDEVLDYLDATEMPHTSQVSGHEPDSPEAQVIAPMSRGAWRVIVLQFFGEWIEENAVWFPQTVQALEPLHGMTSIAFTALDPHSHLESHIGPNRGALRYQLPIVVPGPPGACRIRIEDEMVEWQEGEPVLFDLARDHEAWNDSDETRVLLMVEVPTPLRWPLRWVNAFTQSCYRFFPSYRALPKRARLLALDRMHELRDGHA